MLSQEDLKQISLKGISKEKIEQQLNDFKTGFPFLRLEAAASTEDGIWTPCEKEKQELQKAWEDYKGKEKRIVKFVPASGAASRMFKDLFSFISADYDTPSTEFEKTFFEDIKKFAFYDELNQKCEEKEGADIDRLIEEKKYKAIVSNLLHKEGLNYGQLPKGLLLFHKYDEAPRTPVEEHLTESALYASSNGLANIHFTVSHEHMQLFKDKIKEKRNALEEKYNVKFDISFSEQKASTDTLAVNMDNTPFRNDDGTLLFRPGGHGALIENLNDINADVIFIKNIDNVVPDRLKQPTVEYKQVLAGALVTLQSRMFDYLNLLDSNTYSHRDLLDIADFLENKLYCRNSNIKDFDDSTLAAYLHEKLNRPLRVCGVVKNIGEPGGGPFLTHNNDGSVSLQILESSQIDKNNNTYMKMFTNGTHFNPVDLVCAVRNYKGEHFNLPDFIDKTTGFISQKSKSGKDLKALELPGLWNGAMSNWNTIFIEVPLQTFNPVKTVNDLLREQHQ